VFTKRRSAACFAVALSAVATLTAAGAGGPVFWPTYVADQQVGKKYEQYGAAVTCAPVGPLARSHGTELFGEFACDVQTDTAESVLAVVPTGSATWKVLSLGQPSPVSGRLQGVVAAGAPHRVALLGVGDPHSVMLDDQSTWKLVDAPGRLSRWKPGDVAMVEPDVGRKHFYRVVNKSRGDDFEADFRGFG
jgi:hypothetical protein